MCCCFIFFSPDYLKSKHTLSSHHCMESDADASVHLCRPIIFVRRKHCESGKILVLGAKYWLSTSWWSDEGSSEGTMTQLEGNPKNPDNLLNLLYCPRLAGWLLGEHCISWMPAHGSTPRFWKESTEQRMVGGSICPCSGGFIVRHRLPPPPL